MPKRSYPFSESFSSQYKVHVGQKEMSSCGVFGLRYRQEIYEKTKSLLFNGTKAVMGRIWKAEGEEKLSDVVESDQTSVSAAHQILLRGQTTIGLDGRLHRARSTPGVSTCPPACGVCHRGSALRKCCSQCERLVCSSCVQQCNSCSEICCSVCTVTDYSERYERVLCCGCS